MRFGRRDSTHRQVVDALKALGASVFDCADVGGGFPDLVVGYRGLTYLIEVKSSRGKLRESQHEFAAGWRGGRVYVVRSVADVRQALLGSAA